MRKSLLAALPLAFLAVAGPALAATTTITEDNLGTTAGQWTAFTRDTGSVAFGSDYAAPSGFGSGALQLSTPLSNDKANLMRVPTAAVPLAALRDASYFTYRSASSTGLASQAPAINVEIDFNGAAVPDGFSTLVFEPVYNTGQGAVVENSWQRWTAGGSNFWWSTNPIGAAPNRDTVPTLDAIIAANPDATMGKFGVNAGGGNPGLLGAVDGLTVNGTTYDFGPRVFDKADCKDGGWKTMKDSTGQAFVNQGDCVSYYASNGKTHS